MIEVHRGQAFSGITRNFILGLGFRGLGFRGLGLGFRGFRV